LLTHYHTQTDCLKRSTCVTKKSKLPDLEGSLNEINTLIEKMEQGNLSLEQSLEYFERGINLIKHSQKVLQEAEQRVEILLKKDGNLENYENDTE